MTDQTTTRALIRRAVAALDYLQSADEIRAACRNDEDWRYVAELEDLIVGMRPVFTRLGPDLLQARLEDRARA